MSPPSLHIVTTVPISLYSLLDGQPRRLSEEFVVTLVSSPGPELEATGEREEVRTHAIRMSRRITPFADLRSLWQLARWFRAERPDLVQSYTPKAGLLAMAAARLAGVRIRMHGIVGMPLMEASGPRRQVLSLIERVTYALSTDLTCNSPSLGRWVKETLRPRRKITVVGHGSINGVDGTRFTPPSEQDRMARRQSLGLESTSVVYAFVGRLVSDKGIEELLEAFRLLRNERQDVLLLLVGDEEPNLDPLSAAAQQQLAAGEGVRRIPWQADVRPVYEAADVLVLPSYREGLPNTLLEASACGLPSIATNINGCNEVVVEGRTGLLVPVRAVGALHAAMEALVDSELRARLGHEARRRTIDYFDSGKFWTELINFYRHIYLSRANS